MGVEALGRQGVKLQDYLDIPSFRTGSRTGWIGVQDVTLYFEWALNTPGFFSQLDSAPPDLDHGKEIVSRTFLVSSVMTILS